MPQGGGAVTKSLKDLPPGSPLASKFLGPGMRRRPAAGQTAFFVGPATRPASNPRACAVLRRARYQRRRSPSVPPRYATTRCHSQVTSKVTAGLPCGPDRHLRPPSPPAAACSPLGRKAADSVCHPHLSSGLLFSAQTSPPRSPRDDDPADPNRSAPGLGGHRLPNAREQATANALDILRI